MTCELTKISRDALRLSLLGDGPGVLALYEAHEDMPEIRLKLAAFRERFLGPPHDPAASVSDPYVGTLIRTYREYYRLAFMHVVSATEAEAWLRDRLVRELPGVAGRTSLDELEREIQPAVEQRGLHVMLGMVTPYRALHIWTQQEWKRFPVVLPHKSLELDVCLADGFVELGWFHFVTFGEKYSGGWASSEPRAQKRFWRVRQKYDATDPERFRLFLAHEAQHVADLADFPGIDETALEYRAKLAELLLAADTRPLLEKLRAEASPAPHSPHAYASWQLLSRLSTAMTGDENAMLSADILGVLPASLQFAAAELFAADQQDRNRARDRD
ncbi:MAG: hypothetical protein HY303_07265 [Candidatus Wallbacteria bacterium]|nr:hypothetical protein [Candidatus Wallbacteria bacterium]